MSTSTLTSWGTRTLVLSTTRCSSASTHTVTTRSGSVKPQTRSRTSINYPRQPMTCLESLQLPKWIASSNRSQKLSSSTSAKPPTSPSSTCPHPRTSPSSKATAPAPFPTRTSFAPSGYGSKKPSRHQSRLSARSSTGSASCFSATTATAPASAPVSCGQKVIRLTAYAAASAPSELCQASRLAGLSWARRRPGWRPRTTAAWLVSAPRLISVTELPPSFQAQHHHSSVLEYPASQDLLEMMTSRFLRPLPRRLPPRLHVHAKRTQSSYIDTSTPRPGVGQVTLSRPKALNALCTPLINELNQALDHLNRSDDTSVIVLTGSQKAFAAGADIKEMAPLTFSEAYTRSFIESWSLLTTLVKKPVIAAVSGHALGGGCELAMMCDIIYCTESANFGQPEIKLGTTPGAGGSQRLTRAIGKAKAMELILTGRSFTGVEAERWGVAARAFPTYEALMEETYKLAETIAGYSRVAVMACKEVVNKSQDLSLKDGVEFERRVFHSLFGSRDQKIGMEAFAKKQKAEWKHS
ncbi:hypothetical protein CP532_2402 [Ophiocordyceps camponoti-leonardi (nom. inval.)]|nr:hypothetical protein CP532_2402 [Ophiocordyceps camponoti-leonardi (nom. inval.)]